MKFVKWAKQHNYNYMIFISLTVLPDTELGNPCGSGKPPCAEGSTCDTGGSNVCGECLLRVERKVQLVMSLLQVPNSYSPLFQQTKEEF
jgi:hypothetical protein